MENALNKKNRLVEYALYLGCFLSNLSQLPVFVRAGITQMLAFPGWILLAIAIFLTSRVTLNKSVLRQLAMGMVLVSWLLFDTIIISKNQFNSSLVYSYVISLFIMLLGSWSSEYVDGKVLKNISNIYVVTMLLVAADIFIEYFGVGYNLATRYYAYSSKNSVSQIIFTAILLLITQYKPRRVIWKILQISAIAFELYVIILLRSRATLASLILCVIVMVLSKKIDKRVRAAIAVVGISVIVLLFVSTRFYNFVFNNVLFAGRNASSLNELTSGRADVISNFPKRISGNWLTGIGPTYIDCFPLSAILQFGIIGGIITILISLQPLFESFKTRSASNEWNLLFLIAIGYSANGLFEGLTPFGPGVKCYYMWLLFGILISKTSDFSNEGIYPTA